MVRKHFGLQYVKGRRGRGVVPAIITYVRLRTSFQSSKEKKVG
jgi:hypothetical protein